MVFASSPNSGYSNLTRREKFSFLALYSLIMLNRHGAIPTNVLPEFVEANLVKVYTWEISTMDRVIPFVKLTGGGRQAAKSAYRRLGKDPGAKKMFDQDILKAKDSFPNIKFLMSHQRFLKELETLSFEALASDYDMSFLVIRSKPYERDSSS